MDQELMDPVAAAVATLVGWLSHSVEKLLGAILGAVLALLYIRPKTRGEAAERGCGSALFAFAFGGQIHHTLATFSWTSGFWELNKPEHQFSSYVLSALLAWWILSVLMAVLEIIKVHIIDRIRGLLEKWRTPVP